MPMRFTTGWNVALAVCLAICLCRASGAGERRQEAAHVHGIAEINIAVEGAKAAVEFHVPAESVMGFEHEAKSAADQKKRDAALKTIQQKIAEMVIFEPGRGCKFSPGKVVIAEEHEGTAHASGQGSKSGEHREVRAEFSVVCQKPLAGSRVRFGVSKVFPDIHEVQVQALGDAQQSGATIKKDQGEVKL
jgi:hypothetical protein